MGFIVVFVGGSAAAYESEGGICGEDDGRIVHSSEVSKLDTLEIVISLKVKWVSAEVSLPFRRDLIKAFGCEIELSAVLSAAGLENGFQMFSRSNDCFLNVSEGVKYVEAESEF
jgi:hypothetical protein